MLILTRKTGEAIQIGEGIEIKVVSVKGDQVKIGIEAPRDVEIYRQELYQQIQDENKKAAMISPNLLQQIQKSQK